MLAELRPNEFHRDVEVIGTQVNGVRATLGRISTERRPASKPFSGACQKIGIDIEQPVLGPSEKTPFDQPSDHRAEPTSDLDDPQWSVRRRKLGSKPIEYVFVQRAVVDGFLRSKVARIGISDHPCGTHGAKSGRSKLAHATGDSRRHTRRTAGRRGATSAGSSDRRPATSSAMCSASRSVVELWRANDG